MKKVVAALVLSFFMISSQAYAGDGITMFSGKTLGSGMAINVSAGAPDISFLWLDALSKNMDLGAQLRLGYLTPISYYTGGFWMDFDGQMRAMFINQANFNLALRLDFGLVLVPVGLGNVDVGFNLGPALVIGIPIKNVASINLGLDIPLTITFVNATIAQIPIGVMFGAEYFFSPKMTFVANFEIGPGIIAVSGATTAGFYGMFKIGLNFGL